MAIKQFEIDGIGKIRVQKRRGSRSMRIRISSDGTVTVGIPYWVPFRTAIDFARKQADWISKHRPETKFIKHGQKIGETHTLFFIEKSVSKASLRVADSEVRIMVPHGANVSDLEIQKVAIRGAKKALEKQSHLLTNQLAEYADNLNYRYNTSSCKFMKSKWGSCNSERHITLNYRLLDLPKHLVEYVIIHELVHLSHMNHSKEYWHEISMILPDYKERKRQLKSLRLAW